MDRLKKTGLFIIVICLLVYCFSGKEAIQENKHQTTITPNDWMAMQRLYPYGKIKPEVYRDAIHQVEALMKEPQAKNLPWNFSGPENIGGRITDIECPAGDPQTIYIGASTGGVFKTTNFGETWVNLFSNIPVVTVGDIALDPSDDNIIYVGMGEANSSSFSFLGNGLYKSTDAGATWTHMGLENTAYIGRVVVDYSNSQQIFVASCGYLFTTNDQRGVYRSTDAGQNWERILFLTDSTSAIDLVQHPQNPDILFAAMWERVRGLEYRRSFGESSGIWKSTDGGDTWTELTSGLPTGDNVGRIGLTICESDPDVLYAFYDLPDFEVGVFKTTDGGQSWIRTNDSDLWGINSNFGWYFGQIRVAPYDPYEVYVMGVSLYKSNTGGGSWFDVSGSGIHVDHHALYFDEINNRVLEGNDGGLYYTETSGAYWTQINNLPITQFYAIDMDYQNPERIYGGTQDNNTIRTLTGNIDDWEPILGGDGMYTLVDYTNPDIIYAEYQWGNLHRSDDGGYTMEYIAAPMGGDRVNWSAPLAMHPTNPDILYFGTYRVWKTFNKGATWNPFSGDLTKGSDQYYHTITTLAVSTVNPAIVIAGSGDGKVHVSQDNGASWQDITNGLPDRWVTKVAADPVDAQTIYVTLSGFRWDEPLPHVFKSTDLGQSWLDISTNLPEFPVNDIAIDPDIPEHLIVATDAGVYGSSDGGQQWEWIWTGLPAVPVYMFKIHPPTRTILAGTYGLSTYKASLDEIFTGMSDPTVKTPAKLIISPNPVTSQSRVQFYLEKESRLTGIISDLNGRTVGSVELGPLPGGHQSVPLSQMINVGNLSSGVYILKLKGTNTAFSGKILIAEK